MYHSLEFVPVKYFDLDDLGPHDVDVQETDSGHQGDCLMVRSVRADWAGRCIEARAEVLAAPAPVHDVEVSELGA